MNNLKNGEIDYNIIKEINDSLHFIDYFYNDVNYSLNEGLKNTNNWRNTYMGDTRMSISLLIKHLKTLDEIILNNFTCYYD